MKTLLILPILLLSTVGVAQTSGQQADLRRAVLAQATLLSEAILHDDFATLAQYTHPNVVNFLGGPEKMAAFTEMMMQQMADDGTEILTVAVLDSVAIAPVDTGYHCLVAKTMDIRTSEFLMRSTSYLYGFSDEAGQQWTFVEADELRDERKLKMFFPNFTPALEIPPHPAYEFLTEDEDTPPPVPVTDADSLPLRQLIGEWQYAVPAKHAEDTAFPYTDFTLELREDGHFISTSTAAQIEGDWRVEGSDQLQLLTREAVDSQEFTIAFLTSSKLFLRRAPENGGEAIVLRLKKD